VKNTGRTTLGVMQPYVFPYLGYFQHIHAVDTFILYDDVAFIPRGWINRNAILLHGRRHRFTIPVVGSSQNAEIRDVMVADPTHWRRKLLATIRHAYTRAPYFSMIYPLIEDVFLLKGPLSISELACHSLIATTELLGIDTKIVASSVQYGNKGLGRTDRLIDFCHREGSTRYVNPIGGRHLYSVEDFSAKGIELRFLKMRSIRYRQFSGDSFVSDLSILDVLMFNGPAKTRELLDQYDLL